MPICRSCKDKPEVNIGCNHTSSQARMRPLIGDQGRMVTEDPEIDSGVVSRYNWLVRWKGVGKSLLGANWGAWRCARQNFLLYRPRPPPAWYKRCSYGRLRILEVLRWWCCWASSGVAFMFNFCRLFTGARLGLGEVSRENEVGLNSPSTNLAPGVSRNFARSLSL